MSVPRWRSDAGGWAARPAGRDVHSPQAPAAQPGIGRRSGRRVGPGCT